MSYPPFSPIDSSSLSKAEMAEILAALPTLYSAMDMITFPGTSLRLINQLIPSATFSSYNEIELNTGSARLVIEPDSYTEIVESMKPALWEYRHEHPLMQKLERGEHEGVWMVSDYFAESEFHASGFYKYVFQPVELEDTLCFTLQTSANMKVFYAINSPLQFTERDRTVAALLKPHFIQAFENAIAFTDTQALALLSTRTISETGNHGLILADSHGRIVHANERAGQHLAEAFGCDRGGEYLPPELLRWVSRFEVSLDKPHHPFEITRGNESYVFRCARADDSHWIIATRSFDEAGLCAALQQAFQLTGRQADTLLWLSRGKTNSEIASILDLSERTVAKHLQHLFDRLGVENRHNAALKVIDLMGSN